MAGPARIAQGRPSINDRGACLAPVYPTFACACAVGAQLGEADLDPAARTDVEHRVPPRL